jgi:hypothetical protein
MSDGQAVVLPTPKPLSIRKAWKGLALRHHRQKVETFEVIHGEEMIEPVSSVISRDRRLTG